VAAKKLLEIESDHLLRAGQRGRDPEDAVLETESTG